MSVDRLTTLERRLAILERRQRVSVVMAFVGFAALGIASQTINTGAQNTAAIRAPFRIVNVRGEDIFSVTQAGSETRVSILKGDAVASMWAADADSASLSLGGIKSKAMVRLGVNFNGEGTGSSLLMADDTDELLSVEKGSVEISAPLTVAPKDVPTLRVEHDVVTVTNSMTVRAGKGGNRTSLGPTRLSIHGGDGTSVAASLGLDDAQRGMLRVGNPAGLRAALGFSKSGNGLSLGFFDKAGTDYRAALFASAEGSSLQLKSPKFGIDLNTDGTGSLVNLTNAAGFASAGLEVVTNGSGRLSIGNTAGETVVEAEVTNNGLGVVRAGPGGSGTTGPQGPPSAILGRRK
jgi:hypothetical protein